MFLSGARGRKKMRLRKIITSLFSKLLLIIFLTGFFINLLVAGFFIHILHKTARESYLKNVINYTNYLIEDIGTPPSLERAEAISRDYLIHISYESPEASWSTSENAFRAITHHWRTVYESKGTQVRRSRGRNLVSVSRKDGRFMFILGKDIGSAAGDYSRIAILILLLTTLLCLAYLAIRYLLKPIKWLHEGVKEVGKVLRDELDALGFDTQWIDQPPELQRGGHLFSKMRYISAQLLAYIEGDLWLRLAAHANQQAAEFAALAGATTVPGHDRER